MKEHFFHLTILEQILLVNTAVMFIIWTIAYLGYINSKSYSEKNAFYKVQSVVFPAAIIFLSIFALAFIYIHYIKTQNQNTQQKQNEIQLDSQQKIKQQIKNINKKLFKSKDLSKTQVLELEESRADLYQKLIAQKIDSFNSKINKINFMINEVKNSITELEQGNIENKKELLQIKRKTLQTLINTKKFLDQKIVRLEEQLKKIKENKKSIQALLQTLKEMKKAQALTQGINSDSIKIDTTSKEEFEAIIHGLNRNINKVDSILEINKQIERINKD